MGHGWPALMVVLQDSLLRGLSMLSLPYFPWLRLDWGLYFRKVGASLAGMGVLLLLLLTVGTREASGVMFC